MRTTDDFQLEPALLHAITQAVKQALGDIPSQRPTVQPGLIMRISEVSKSIGLSESTIRNFLDVAGRWHDPSFPRPICLGSGTGTRSSIGFRRVDIESWVNSRPVALTHQLDKVPSKAKPRRRAGQLGLLTPLFAAGPGITNSGSLSNFVHLGDPKWKF